MAISPDRIPDRLPVWLPPFNRNRKFLCRVKIEMPGKTFQVHEEFDKSLVNTRFLRQLYDQRRIVDVGPETAPAPPVAVKAPEPDTAKPKKAARKPNRRRNAA